MKVEEGASMGAISQFNNQYSVVSHNNVAPNEEDTHMTVGSKRGHYSIQRNAKNGKKGVIEDEEISGL